jgi:hypothetical protein
MVGQLARALPEGGPGGEGVRTNVPGGFTLRHRSHGTGVLPVLLRVA